MSEPVEHDELWELIDASCDGRLEPADVARLQSLLDDPAKLDRYLHYFQMHAELHFRIRADRVGRRGLALALNEPPAGPLGETASLPLPLDGISSPPVSFAVAAGARKLSWWLLGSPLRRAMSAVAALLLALGGWWLAAGPADELVAERERQPIASLMASKDSQWQAGFKPREGAKLMEGQVLRLLKGRAQVSMSCGADLVLKAPCSIVLSSSHQVRLDEGLVSVQVADWAGGFTVATDSVHIVDLGKQFVVSADPKTGAVEAHAVGRDSQLRVLATNVPEAERRGLLVSSGEAIRILPVSNTSIRLKANDSLFDRSLADAHPFRPLEIHNTGQNLLPGDEDPHWRIVKSSSTEFEGPQFAVAAAHRKNYLPNDPEVSQWISTSQPLDDNCPPNTMYTFETNVDLTGYDLATVTIVAQVMADNGVTSVRVNGRSIDFKPWIHNDLGDAYKFKTFQKVEIVEGLVEGVNAIQFDVWNGVNPRRQHEHNPMALRVEWQAYGRLKDSSAATERRRRFHEVDFQPAPPFAVDAIEKLPLAAHGRQEGV